MIPQWLQVFSWVSAIAVLAVIPFQLWTTWRSIRQYRKWERDEDVRFQRWRVEMDQLARERIELDQMRAELTIELAQARGNTSVTRLR
jgi:hypothetical protein